MMDDNQNAITQMQGSEQGIDADQMPDVIRRVESRYQDQAPATSSQATAGVTYKLLKTTHPEYDAGYWRRLRALYAGGKKLLGDLDLLHEIFPKHRDEHPSIYRERIRRAFYTPYAGEIVDHIMAALCSQPIKMTTEAEAGSAEEPGEWWKEFYKDVSPQGGEKQGFRELLKECVLTAQQCRRAWVLVDIPTMISDDGQAVAFTDRKAQEDAGALDAWAVEIQPECVVDWEDDESGKLIWVLIHTVDNSRGGLLETRDYVTDRWTYYTRDGWAKYAHRHKKTEPIKDTTVISLVAHGSHTFGEVPMCRFILPEGLWTMEKLEGLAREHFNKRSGLAWGELQSLLPELYEFLGPERSTSSPFGVPTSEAQEDPDRALTQARGQGFVQIRGADDDAKFVGPDTGPFTEARASCKETRDEMHRVTHQMALSTDNSAAALGRSGDSKAQDAAATAVVLQELGKMVRHFAEAIYRLVAIARGEPFADEWQAQGMEKFDELGVNEEIEQALVIDQLDLESPTFRRRHRFKLIKLKLGDDATQEDLDQIERELEQNIPDEWQTSMDPKAVAFENVSYVTGDEDDDEELDDIDPDDQPPRRSRVSIATGNMRED